MILEKRWTPKRRKKIRRRIIVVAIIATVIGMWYMPYETHGREHSVSTGIICCFMDVNG